MQIYDFCQIFQTSTERERMSERRREGGREKEREKEREREREGSTLGKNLLTIACLCTLPIHRWDTIIEQLNELTVKFDCNYVVSSGWILVVAFRCFILNRFLKPAKFQKSASLSRCGALIRAHVSSLVQSIQI